MFWNKLQLVEFICSKNLPFFREKNIRYVEQATAVIEFTYKYKKVEALNRKPWFFLSI